MFLLLVRAGDEGDALGDFGDLVVEVEELVDLLNRVLFLSLEVNNKLLVLHQVRALSIEAVRGAVSGVEDGGEDVDPVHGPEESVGLDNRSRNSEEELDRASVGADGDPLQAAPGVTWKESSILRARAVLPLDQGQQGEVTLSIDIEDMAGLLEDHCRWSEVFDWNVDLQGSDFLKSAQSSHPNLHGVGVGDRLDMTAGNL